MTAADLSNAPFEELLSREWLAVNHLGGYASSTLCGMNTRKYHGLLVAAMAPPVRRMVLLSRVEEMLWREGRGHALASIEYPDVIAGRGHEFLRAFDAEPFPRWAYQGEGWTIEKSLRLLHGENTVVLSYTLLGGERPVQLEVSPLLALRGIHELMYQWNGRLCVENRSPRNHRIPPTSRTPEVFFAHDGAFEPRAYWYLNTIYRRENERGYAGLEDLWLPGAVRWTIAPGQTVHFVCSAEPIELDRCVSVAHDQYEAVAERRAVAFPMIRETADPVLENLARAADQFTANLPPDRRPAVVSGFPWPCPSGRSALVALPGLYLCTGRIDEAEALLAGFIAVTRDGLMPSEFPEDGAGPLYRGADVSLWWANAAHHTLCYAPEDIEFNRAMLEAMTTIIASYRAGTGLGIKVDGDGLLETRAEGIGTTWMDAHLAGGPVTPRQGKPVELNALWYNALCVAEELAERLHQVEAAVRFMRLAGQVRAAFNEAFWNEAEGCCFDVLGDDGPDASIRPSQLLAVSLPHSVLAMERHSAVLDKVQAELLTSFGLRTLSPRHPAYRGHYGGDVAARDRAYHQGSAYPWLLGPLVTATLRVHGRNEKSRASAQSFIEGPLNYMRNEGQGQLCELFDGDSPHRPGGALASARAVAELLRCYTQDILNLYPEPRGDERAPEMPRVPGAVLKHET